MKYSTGEPVELFDLVRSEWTDGVAMVTRLEAWSGRVYFLRRGAIDSSSGDASELALVRRYGAEWADE